MSNQSETDAPFTHISFIHGSSLEETDYIHISNEKYLNGRPVFNMTARFTK